MSQSASHPLPGGPRFRPAYMAAMNNFFKRMDEDDVARAEFLSDPDNMMRKCGLKDRPPGVSIIGHADSEHLRTLVLPPSPPPAPPLAETAGLGTRATQSARESLELVHLGRTDVMLWTSLIEVLWSNRDLEHLAPCDRIMLAAWRDKKFKTRLLAEPATVMKEYGMEIPAGIEIRVVEQTPDVVHIVLPPKGSFAKLSYETFEELTSGWNWWRALGQPGLQDVTA